MHQWNKWECVFILILFYSKPYSMHIDYSSIKKYFMPLSNLRICYELPDGDLLTYILERSYEIMNKWYVKVLHSKMVPQGLQQYLWPRLWIPPQLHWQKWQLLQPLWMVWKSCFVICLKVTRIELIMLRKFYKQSWILIPFKVFFYQGNQEFRIPCLYCYNVMWAINTWSFIGLQLLTCSNTD